MVKIISNKKIEELNGNPLESFENLGVNFSCHSGICGICKIKVKKGMNNINPKTESEEDFPMKENERLACQCQTINGDIEIENADW